MDHVSLGDLSAKGRRRDQKTYSEDESSVKRQSDDDRFEAEEDVRPSQGGLPSLEEWRSWTAGFERGNVGETGVFPKGVGSTTKDLDGVGFWDLKE
jgi:hypothetical protein